MLDLMQRDAFIHILRIKLDAFLRPEIGALRSDIISNIHVEIFSARVSAVEIGMVHRSAERRSLFRRTMKDRILVCYFETPLCIRSFEPTGAAPDDRGIGTLSFEVLGLGQLSEVSRVSKFATKDSGRSRLSKRRSSSQKR